MKQTCKPHPKGSVRIYKLTESGQELILEKSNSILPNSTEVLAAMMALQVGAKLDMIEIYLSGSLLCARPILTTTLPSADTVQYQANFEMTSFSGNYDNVKLISTTFGEFSEFPVSLNKATSEQIAIVWNIQIL